MKSGGWTLPEMLISLVITGGIFALAAHHAVSQLRAFDGVATVAGMRGQLAHANGIAARALWGVAPVAGDITQALDSAIEFQAPTGTAVACAATPGQLVVPAAERRGNTLSAFWDLPDFGDRAHVFFDDSVGTGWLTVHVAAPAIPGPACPRLGVFSTGWLIQLREPVVVPEGAVVRFTRAVRYSLYSASDSRWYLGARDWNEGAARFNAVQPVAGPLRPYSPLAERSGLVFRYWDRDGQELPSPPSAPAIALVSVTSRGEADRALRIPGRSGFGRAYVDSSESRVALRNAQ
jgi:type II secretory pathway pseudopilin PulG